MMRARMRAARQTGWLLVCLLLVAACMFVLNMHTPLMMDDYDYSFSWHTGRLLEGPADVIASQAAHYRLWGGRSVAHTLVQLFLYWGKPVFNAANTCMYLLLLLEIAALAVPRGRRISGSVILAVHLTLTCLPFFGTVFLWLDGACNYLWCTALALVPLLILRSEREGGYFDAGLRRAAPVLPVFFFAGWTNENTACGILAVMVLLMAYDVLIRKRVIRGWRFAALALHALGTAIMLLAPGNFARASAQTGRGLVMELLYRFAVVSLYTCLYTGLLVAVLAAAWLLARRRKAALRVEWTAVLLFGGLLAAYALVGSPQISDRSFTAAYALVLSAALAAVYDLAAVGCGRGCTAARCALAAAAIAGMCMAVPAVMAHEAAWLSQVNAIVQAAERGDAQVTVCSVPSGSRFTMSVRLEEDAAQWPNSTLSRYYGIDVKGSTQPM